MSNKTKIAIGLTTVVLFVGILISVSTYNKNKIAFKEEKEQAILEYYEYVSNSDYYLWDKYVYAPYEFYLNMNYNRKLQEYMKNYVEEDIERGLNNFLKPERFYESDIEKTRPIVELQFVSQESKRKFKDIEDIFIRYNQATQNMSQEEINKGIETVESRVNVGMDSNMVKSKIGEPKDKTVAETSYGTSEIWRYDDKTIYFTNGEVEGIVY